LQIVRSALLVAGALGLSISSSYAAVIGVDSANALGANDAIGWGQLNLPAGQAVQAYTGPLNVVASNGNGATVSVGGDHMLVRVDQAPGGDSYGNFPPGMPLIDTCGNCQSGGSPEPIVIDFRHPVYGGGAQIEAGDYDGFTATVTAFDGKTRTRNIQRSRNRYDRWSQ
jgi:hypothetical protein